MKIETDINVDSIVDVNDFAKSSPLDLAYPFIDKLKMNVDDVVDLPIDSRVDMCIYRIKRNKTPFLEFLLYLDGKKGGRALAFPYILSKHTKAGLVDQCTAPLSALFATTNEHGLDDVVKYAYIKLS